MRRWLWLPLVLVGCTDPIDESNTHRACVWADEPGDFFQIDPEGGPTIDYVADQTLWVGVDHGCLGCNKNLEHGCSITVTGDEIEIESTFSFERPRGSCDASCEQITSRCETEDPVPAGTYTVSYAGETAQLEIPGEREALCFDPT